MYNKRGQVVLFVIVGVVILLIVGVFFFIANKDEVFNQPPSKVPRLFIEQCIAEAVSPSVKAVLDYGGLAIPRHFISRNDHPYNYLCFVDNYHQKCYNYYPHLHLTTQEQIRKDSVERVEQCFQFLIEDYESRGFDVDSEPLEYDVEVVPGSVRLRIEKPISTTKGSSVDSYRDFNMKIPSDLYDLIAITRNIVNQEAEFCYFENNGFMVLYPTYNVTRFDFVESKIYEVQNRHTKETFKFAVRTCAFEPGFGSGGLDPSAIGGFSPVGDVRSRFGINQ